MASHKSKTFEKRKSGLVAGEASPEVYKQYAKTGETPEGYRWVTLRRRGHGGGSRGRRVLIEENAAAAKGAKLELYRYPVKSKRRGT